MFLPYCSPHLKISQLYHNLTNVLAFLDNWGKGDLATDEDVRGFWGGSNGEEHGKPYQQDVGFWDAKGLLVSSL